MRKQTALFALAGLLVGLIMIATGCQQEQTAEFAIESLAMAVGYELRDSFEWTPDADRYYNAIMAGNVSLDGAKAAEAYLRTVTHPLIANRMVALAGMVGFDLDAAGSVVGIGKVDIRLLQVAAQGFRMGTLLADKSAGIDQLSDINLNVFDSEGFRSDMRATLKESKGKFELIYAQELCGFQSDREEILSIGLQ